MNTIQRWSKKCRIYCNKNIIILDTLCCNRILYSLYCRYIIYLCHISLRMSWYRFYHYFGYPEPTSSHLKRFENISISSPILSTCHSFVHATNFFPIAQRCRYIPRIQKMYCSGEYTFGVDTHTIGICVITQHKRLRLTTVFLIIILPIYNFFLPSWGYHIKLEAIIDCEDMSLYWFSYKPIDPYLVYRIAHLSLMYADHNENSQDIFSYNYRIRNTLPWFELKQVLEPISKVILWSSKLKLFLQWISKKSFGNICELIIKFFAYPLFIFKYYKIPKKARYITDYYIIKINDMRFSCYLAYKHHCA